MTHFFRGPDDADEPSGADAFVAGPDSLGRWWSGESAGMRFERAN